MRRKDVIRQDGAGEMTTYGASGRGMSAVIIIALLLPCWGLAASVYADGFSDPAPEDLVIDNMANPEAAMLAAAVREHWIEQLNRGPPLGQLGADSDQLPLYEFPPLNSDRPRFAYTPDDPRFYDTRQVDPGPALGFTRGSLEREEWPRAGQREYWPLEEGHRSSDVNLEQKEPGGERAVPAQDDDSTPRSVNDVHAASVRSGPQWLVAQKHVSGLGYERPQKADSTSDIYFTAIVAGCSAAAVVGVVAAGIFWYKLQRRAKAAAEAEYPAYGVTGPRKDLSPPGDRKLAQSAQMYHYQHQKQQMIALESSRASGERTGSASDAESEEENEEGDYTVYECPGLAPTGEMEVKNPLFHDEPTPATPALVVSSSSMASVTSSSAAATSSTSIPSTATTTTTTTTTSSNIPSKDQGGGK